MFGRREGEQALALHDALPLQARWPMIEQNFAALGPQLPGL